MSAEMRQVEILSPTRHEGSRHGEQDIREALRPLARLIAQAIDSNNLTKYKETASLDDIDGVGDAA